MSEPKLISPLLDNFIMGDPISDQNGVRCCPAMENGSDDKYIVKIISIPASQSKLDALLLSGAYPNVEACETYFKELAGDLVKEIDVLQKLSSQEGFMACEGYQVVPMEDGTGFEVYLLTRYRRSLERQCKKVALTHLDALNLGLDMCSALTACRRSGFLYVALKPANIYITENNEYRIGDLGFISLNSLKYASLPEKYLSAYTAPEITDAFSALNTSLDIYALGAVLYQIYNGGELPTAAESSIPAPKYADSEIAQIILKALDPEPANRWEDPAQMGQAIVSYMQRCGASSEPIVPPVIPEPEHEEEVQPEESIEDILSSIDLEEDVLPESILEAAESEDNDTAPTPILPDEPQDSTNEASVDESATPEASEASPVQEACGSEADSALYSEDTNGNLCFINDQTDDLPITEINTEDASCDEEYDDVTEILSQVDALAEHEVPEPVIVPDPIDVPIPEPEPAPEPDPVPFAAADPTAEPEILDEAAPAPVPTDAEVDEALMELGKIDDFDAEPPAQDTPEDDVVEYDEEIPSKPKKKWVKYLLLALLLLLLLGGGFLFYRFYYLQTIEDLQLIGSKDQLTVSVTTNVDNDLLTVLCENALYGKTVEVPVVDGKAYLNGLLADTEYIITVKISGFHSLTGDTTASYFSPDESSIVQFDALTGNVDGSAELRFTLDGPDADNWTVIYSAPGEEEKSVQFSGHSVILSGLTVGAKYTARLQPDTDLYLTGITEVTFVASNVIQANDLMITSLTDGKLTASWTAPENEIVEGWIVRCYNDSDYKKEFTTNNTTVTFSDLDHTDGFTVEVTAVGQSLSQSTQIGENSITVSNMTADTSVDGTITLTWDSTAVPEGGWIINYTVEGMDAPLSAPAEGNSLSIISALPGLKYEFSIQAADDTPVVYVPATCTTASASNFRREYLGYTVTRNNLSFGMCRTPNKADWDYKDVPGSAYTRVFEVGERASFVIFLNRVYGTSSEVINTTFAFYNEEGKLVDICTSSRTWTQMWYKNYCEMDIPSMPKEIGNYTVRIYFNGEYVTTQSFSITE